MARLCRRFVRLRAGAEERAARPTRRRVERRPVRPAARRSRADHRPRRSFLAGERRGRRLEGVYVVTHPDRAIWDAIPAVEEQLLELVCATQAATEAGLAALAKIQEAKRNPPRKPWRQAQRRVAVAS